MLNETIAPALIWNVKHSECFVKVDQWLCSGRIPVCNVVHPVSILPRATIPKSTRKSCVRECILKTVPNPCVNEWEEPKDKEEKKQIYLFLFDTSSSSIIKYSFVCVLCGGIYVPFRSNRLPNKILN